ncbi:MAG: hypothetical protein GY715_04220 [Planctomycetes bacterium]|nr:hypothetical protein [Planctomycetota bacterium]
MNIRSTTIAALAAAGLCTGMTFAQATDREQAPRESRLAPIPVELETMRTLRVTKRGRVLSDTTRSLRGNLPPASTLGTCPIIVETHTDADFTGGTYVAQGGFGEQEIAAASYVVAAGEFPLKLELAEMIFATSGAVEQTTTHWSLLVWEGTPNNGNVVAEFSSDGLILPHLIMPPGTNGTNVQVSVDPGDPEQIIITDNGSNTFSVGYRIDMHNNQTQDPCFFPPPSSSNAFPATDFSGLAEPDRNWLNGVNCGFLGCPANGGWATFQQLPGSPGTLCTPSGDWVIRASWSSFNCAPGVGACCIDDACLTLNEVDCLAFSGVYEGAGTTCEVDQCASACCFEDTGGCLDLEVSNCQVAGGVYQGNGTECATTVCFPSGACCLGDGSCLEDQSEDDCTTAGGTFQGDGVTCAAASCPQPTGACCFEATGGCLDFTDSDCTTAAGSWQGPGTSCASTPCEQVGACCLAAGGCLPLNETDCGQIPNSTFAGGGTTCPGACAPACPEDLNGNNQVDFADILAIIAAWGPCGAPCPQDLNGNNQVDFADILAVIAAWGPC